MTPALRSFFFIIILFVRLLAVAKVTTHYGMLTETERLVLCEELKINNVTLLSLRAFETEQQFNQQLRYCIYEGVRRYELCCVANKQEQ